MHLQRRKGVGRVAQPLLPPHLQHGGGGVVAAGLEQDGGGVAVKEAAAGPGELAGGGLYFRGKGVCLFDGGL